MDSLNEAQSRIDGLIETLAENESDIDLDELKDISYAIRNYLHDVGHYILAHTL